MTLSVTDPLGRAITRTREILFDPFDLRKWFTLGFCAFLAHLGDYSGGNGNLGSWQDDGNTGELVEFDEWVGDYSGYAIAIGISILLLVLAVTVLVLWLQGRGRFMFLDGVVRNRGAVVEPWKRFRAEGNSAFLFALCAAFLGLAALVLAVAIGVGLAWPDIEAERFETAAWGGVLIGGTLFFLTVVTMILVDVFLTDFVVPAMYTRGVGVMDGWRIVKYELLAEHPGAVALYVLMKILISVVSGLIVMGVVCVTLCIAACFLMIPYIGTVLILPLLVFNRCYSIYFLEQLGEPWVRAPRAPGEPLGHGV